MLFIRHLNECNECVDYKSQWLMLLFVNIDNKYSVSLYRSRCALDRLRLIDYAFIAFVVFLMIFCREKQRTNAKSGRTKVADWQDVGVEKIT